jgi:AP2 domain
MHILLHTSLSYRKGANKKKELRMARTKKITGVSYESARGMWRARPTINGRRVHLGYFTSERKAIQAIRTGLTNTR